MGNPDRKVLASWRTGPIWSNYYQLRLECGHVVIANGVRNPGAALDCAPASHPCRKCGAIPVKPRSHYER